MMITLHRPTIRHHRIHLQDMIRDMVDIMVERKITKRVLAEDIITIIMIAIIHRIKGGIDMMTIIIIEGRGVRVENGEGAALEDIVMTTMTDMNDAIKMDPMGKEGGGRGAEVTREKSQEGTGVLEEMMLTVGTMVDMVIGMKPLKKQHHQLLWLQRRANLIQRRRDMA
jgi:hypothetical protein